MKTLNRRKTREVRIGKVGVGGDNPVRIQSMTTSSTREVEATISQIMRLADAGCEIARVTVQGMKEAESCEAIKTGLVQKGYDIPLVADIHFYPPAAMRVADFVDKVRINPGNFVDRRATFKTLFYDEATYAAEIRRLEEGFAPLVEKCKKRGIAMRIGTNHGSLSDRIMNRYGDTPAGMVESAFEFARVCRALDYHDFLFSMKSSNPLVMIQAYRLLVLEMEKIGWEYPLHLGVTEAGEGEDGRIKSAVGIGSLLLDGIGDTIRVSLTEDPWEEIDPCRRLCAFAQEHATVRAPDIGVSRRRVALDPPLHRDGSVFVFQQGTKEPFADGILKGREACIEGEDEAVWEAVVSKRPAYILLSPKENRLAVARRFFAWLKEPIPVILAFEYDGDFDDLVIASAAECGSLLTDGLGEGIALKTPHDVDRVCALSFNILQAVRMRTFKTEYISCPGCGRTLFQLQEVTRRIRGRTAHLPGVKIAIMGCIVNGPGEMADADFGYVGSKPGKIDLYVGKRCVERDIDEAVADERLIDLIKAHGRWVEPKFPIFT